MAFRHIQFNDQIPHGRLLRTGFSQVEEGIDRLVKVRETMTLMIDNAEGKDIGNFNEVVARFGFASNDDAKAAWDALNAMDEAVGPMKKILAEVFAQFR